MSYSVKNIFNILFFLIIIGGVFFLVINLLPVFIIVGIIIWIGFSIYKRVKLWFPKKGFSSKSYESFNPDVYESKDDEFDLTDKTVIDVDYENLK